MTTLTTHPVLETGVASGPRARRPIKVLEGPRAALFALLAATAVLYIWGLSANGWANAYYAAAARAGSESWKAWFFGSFDASNAITVDKTPASLWIMDGRIHYFVVGGGMRSNGGSEAAQEVATWVAENYTAQTIGEVTIYDLA